MYPGNNVPPLLDEEAEARPGDYVEIFEFDGKLTVIKKVMGSSAGSLKYLKPRMASTDNESLQDALQAS